MRIMYSAGGLRWGIRAPDKNAKIGPVRVRGRRRWLLGSVGGGEG
jgi:hypothetical protein